MPTYVPYSVKTQQQDPQDPPPFLNDDDLTYDDILHMLNVRINQGQLVYQEQPTAASQAYALPQNANHHRITNAQKVHASPAPLHPAYQNSYIHNKYFKKFANEPAAPEPLPPMTRQEYMAYLHKKAAEDALQRQRIREIKSTKLRFNNGNNDPIHIKTPSHVDGNKMFRLKGIWVDVN